MLPLLLSLLALPTGGLPEAAPEETSPAAESRYEPGQVEERIACDPDPTQSYALYLPSAYTPEKRWPLLIAMDPRGRAMVPVHLFREAAERLGYIVISSYDTASDGPREPNIRAFAAMLPDSQARFSVDPRRIYLTGFSGTARVAWDFAYLVRGIAGLIGVGAALPSDLREPTLSTFVYFGTAGNTDFNYEEMRQLDARLDDVGIAHRFAYFDGGHQWCPQPVCERALDWMELQSMRKGLRDIDDRFVAGRFEAWLGEAESLESSGDLYEALTAYQGLVEDFTGLRDVAPLREKADALSVTKAVRRRIDVNVRIAREQADFQERLYQYAEEVRHSRPPSSARALATLKIKGLQKRARSDDPLEARAAQRLLELAFTNTSFYEPGDHLRAGHPDKALALLLVADAIKPDHPLVCYGLAQAHAQLGETEEALASVACFADSGFATPGRLESDPLLAPLREDDAFQAIVTRLREQAPPDE